MKMNELDCENATMPQIKEIIKDANTLNMHLLDNPAGFAMHQGRQRFNSMVVRTDSMPVNTARPSFANNVAAPQERFAPMKILCYFHKFVCAIYIYVD